MLDAHLESLQYLLEIGCDDLQCYGESYQPIGKLYHFVRAYSAPKVKITKEIYDFSKTGPSETYPRGKGLVGTCAKKAEYEIRGIETLLEDQHLFMPGGPRLRESNRFFHTAITIPLERISMTDDGAGTRGKLTSSVSYSALKLNSKEVEKTLIGILVLYLSKPLERMQLVAVHRYMETFMKFVGPSVELMRSRCMMHLHLPPRTITSANLHTIEEGNSNEPYNDVAHHGMRKPTNNKYTGTDGSVQENDAAVEPRERRNSALEGDGSDLPHEFQSIREVEMLEISRDDGDSEEELDLKSVLSIPSQKALRNWWRNYFRKMRGIGATLPGPLKNKYCVIAFVGCFGSFAIMQLICDGINNTFRFNGQSDLFKLPSSFGALCTLVFALPSAPLVQPRIIVMSHSWAMIVSITIIFIFERNRYVYVQQALAVAFTTSGMAKFGCLHPPAGALSIALVAFANESGYSDTGLLFQIVSVFIGCAVLIFLGMLMHNATFNRTYPTAW
jgi:hypothetical protein